MTHRVVDVRGVVDARESADTSNLPGLVARLGSWFLRQCSSEVFALREPGFNLPSGLIGEHGLSTGSENRHRSTRPTLTLWDVKTNCGSTDFFHREPPEPYLGPAKLRTDLGKTEVLGTAIAGVRFACLPAERPGNIGTALSLRLDVSVPLHRPEPDRP